MNLDIRQGDCRELLAAIPAGSVRCCVTSPPYWGLRDYGHPEQIGLERTPEEYVWRMVEVFGAVRRVLADDGTLWLNLGDSYSGSGKGGNPEGSPWAGFVSRGEHAAPSVRGASTRWPEAQGPRRHSLARRVCAPGGRLVAALGHHLEQAEPDAGERYRPADEGA